LLSTAGTLQSEQIVELKVKCEEATARLDKICLKDNAKEVAEAEAVPQNDGAIDKDAERTLMRKLETRPRRSNASSVYSFVHFI
jgi:hypothetical protein